MGLPERSTLYPRVGGGGGKGEGGEGRGMGRGERGRGGEEGRGGEGGRRRSLIGYLNAMPTPDAFL